MVYVAAVNGLIEVLLCGMNLLSSLTYKRWERNGFRKKFEKIVNERGNCWRE
jgi:hypothetical protein